jgi:succinoglycan biosynthesis protein ExoA
MEPLVGADSARRPHRAEPAQGPFARLEGAPEAPPPEISVLIPCRNEEAHLRACLDSLLDDFVRSRCEVLVIDGRSTDGSREIVREYESRHPAVRLLDNPEAVQAAALNVGIEAARGTIVVRADAHSTYPPGYVQRCVELLHRTGATNVGGVMAPQGRGLFEQAVAAAMMHPAGIGGAKFHWGTYTGYADTVYLGTFRRSDLLAVGGFDPRAHPAEDAELNLRLLKRNGTVFLDGSLRVTYQPRQSLRRLVKQFFHYGRGRCYIVLKHRRLLVPGRVLPPLLVLVLAASLVLGVFQHPAWLAFAAAYLVGVLAASVVIGGRGSGRLGRMAALIVVLPVMHLAYGTGFLAKLLGIVE